VNHEQTGSGPLAAIGAVVGRVMIAAIFLLSAVGNKIPNFGATVETMAKEGIPLPQVALVGAIVFLIAGSLSIIFGYKTAVGAALLLVFLLLATFYFHDFWTFQGEEAEQQRNNFMKNVSLMGTMIFLMAVGPGPASLDRRSE